MRSLLIAVFFAAVGAHSHAAGTGLTGQYYDASDFTTLKTTRTDATAAGATWAGNS